MKLIEPPKAAPLPLLLAVDDQPENLRLLGNTLDGQGVSLAFAMSGEEALEWLEEHEPDLILLDVSMPGINGVECCRKLKTDKRFTDTPVIFLTARVETSDIERGFEAGAVDYVSKPFKGTELISRVKTHLKLQAQRKELELNLQQKSELIGIISHDVRGPISSIRCISELIMSENMIPEDDEKFQDVRELLEAIIGSADKTLYTLNELLNAKFSESGTLEAKVEEVQLGDVLEGVRLRNAGQALRKQITLRFDASECQTAYADFFLLTEVIDNLVSNAVKYSNEGSVVKVIAKRDDHGQPHLLISDQGPGFQAEDYDKLFVRFQRLSATPTGGESSFGLGLSLVKEMMQAQGGDVELVSEPGESARFQLIFAEPTPKRPASDTIAKA